MSESYLCQNGPKNLKKKLLCEKTPGRNAQKKNKSTIRPGDSLRGFEYVKKITTS
jgi:hypothetical protein